MPELAPPSGAPGGLNLKKLPPWAWGLAIAGGAVVGFVFLKKGGGDGGGGSSDASSPSSPSSSDAAGAGGGAPAAPPLTPPALDSLFGQTGAASYSNGISGGGGVGGGDPTQSSDVGLASSSVVSPTKFYDVASTLGYGTAQATATATTATAAILRSVVGGGTTLAAPPPTSGLPAGGKLVAS